MFISVPFLTKIYKGKIFSNEYQKNRMLESLYSTDRLFKYQRYENKTFYVSYKENESLLEKSLLEIYPFIE